MYLILDNLLTLLMRKRNDSPELIQNDKQLELKHFKKENPKIIGKLNGSENSRR